ncbi:MAG TPA: hypothetical protein VFO77_10195, partial [Actinoplanes sp.]|nr:hypothetical protein [Actinoplanes sp.]
CLISPVTWVHHCVWIIPALVRCLDAGLAGPRRWPLGLAGTAYLLMTSRLLFAWEFGPRPPLAALGSNLYVWFLAALLIWTPIVGTRREVCDVPHIHTKLVCRQPL